MKCPVCGAENLDSSFFCSNCEAELIGGNIPAPPVTEPEKGTRYLDIDEDETPIEPSPIPSAGVSSDAVLNEGLNLLKEGRPDEAISVFAGEIRNNPQDWRSYEYLGICYGQMKDYDKSIQAFERALQIESSIARLYYNLGEAYRSANREVEAMASFQAALDTDPAYAKANLRLDQMKK
ncbi:MAG: tetratricopeptide repeat protein [Patescibacteria group bacterium]|nr:tetratricopeptide repeat protein [Patescibacteria group bacterium]